MPITAPALPNNKPKEKLFFGKSNDGGRGTAQAGGQPDPLREGQKKGDGREKKKKNTPRKRLQASKWHHFYPSDGAHDSVKMGVVPTVLVNVHLALEVVQLFPDLNRLVRRQLPRHLTLHRAPRGTSALGAHSSSVSAATF